jgi:hypothetical protein
MIGRHYASQGPKTILKEAILFALVLLGFGAYVFFVYVNGYPHP